MKTIKKFDEKDISGKEYNALAENELKLMKSIDHDHVVQYFDDFTLDIFDSSFFAIVVEFCQVHLLYLALVYYITKYIIRFYISERQFELTNRRIQGEK
jgi:serine/threonine protein kinase